MAQFSTTDMYLAAYMRRHATKMECKRVGGKVMFNFEFNDVLLGSRFEEGKQIAETPSELLHRLYYEDEDLQSFIENLKELRGKVHNLMKQ